MTKYIFPVKTCTRCGGTGNYSYNQIDGTRCYGCNGGGVQLANKKVSAIAAEVNAIRSNLVRPQASQIKIGDRIRAYSSKEEYRTVTDFAIYEWEVSHGIQNEYFFVLDGEEIMRVSANGLVNRFFSKAEFAAIRAPFVEQAYATLTKKQREENEAIQNAE